MMNTKLGQTRQIPAMEVSEGAGVTVYRTLGTPALRNLDPFMMLDYFSSDNPDEYIAGFPPHPHRGFNTFTYMIDGHMQHQDSMGNTGDLGPGSAQWMKAASGVIHSEMPQQENGLMRGFQLWINLPAANKMDSPEYQEYTADSFPVIESEGTRVKVLIGEYANQQSPIKDMITEAQYIDVEVAAGQRFEHALPQTHNTMLYLFEGDASVNGQPVAKNSLIAASHSETSFSVTANEQGARFIIVSGKPINESVVQYGPFVMNTRQEIDQAMQDYQENKLVKDKAKMNL